MTREVTAGEFCARLSAQDRHDVEVALTGGMGVARFGGLNVTYGNRNAVISSRYPPASFGGAELGDFVPPSPASTGMRSPLMDATMGPPQIRRPRVAPGYTEYPEVRIETRTSSHPRGSNGQAGYIEAPRPGREPQQPEETVPVQLSEEAKWWADHL